MEDWGGLIAFRWDRSLGPRSETCWFGFGPHHRLVYFYSILNLEMFNNNPNNNPDIFLLPSKSTFWKNKNLSIICHLFPEAGLFVS